MKQLVSALLGVSITLLGVVLYINFLGPQTEVNQEVLSLDTGDEIVSLNTPTPIPTIFPTPTPLPQVEQVTTTTAGGLLVFNKYTIVTPNDWIVTKTQPVPQGEKLVIAKGGYEISIYQAATGGNQCVYSPDPTPLVPSASYTKFVELTTGSLNKLRRSQETSGFTVCELLQSTWMAPTSFGHIAIKTPIVPDALVIAEIDKIVSSLKKI